MSVYVPILVGKYDARLNWPFIGRVKISLLNQLKNENHYNKIVEFTAEKTVCALKDSHDFGVLGFHAFHPSLCTGS